MTQRLGTRQRNEVTEALHTVEAQFDVASQSLPHDILIVALMDAIQAQCGAYARVCEMLVACPGLVDKSMQRCAPVPLLFSGKVM